MSEENVELVRRLYEAFARLDPVAIELLHPEAELHQAPEQPDSRSYYGRDEFVRGVADFHSAWKDIRYEPREISAVGDCVVIDMQLAGTGKGSGVQTKLSLFHVWTVRDRKAHRCFVRMTREEALEAAGLAE